MEAQIKGKFTFVAMYWIRLLLNDGMDQFPQDVIQLIVNIFLYSPVKFLKFSSKYKSTDAIQLTDGNKCATIMESKRHRDHVFIDEEPVRSGIHVWRFKVTAFIYAAMKCIYC